MWIWRGAPELANTEMLPTHPTPEATHSVETILDYGCDWSYIVENNLDTPHLYWLHDGPIPPTQSLGCPRKEHGYSKGAFASFDTALSGTADVELAVKRGHYASAAAALKAAARLAGDDCTWFPASIA